ncbi:D-alanyl-D-alanine carboxypeptidase/D-alanyl-D-alanine-endopeptidase [Sphingomonas tabacisoli]|uniref:D-alanyl-D-alanine carboxypeptidase/D-alanyl-D-alanine-endopeptidase n=1 Tax=Sphingomonas tabacisoli TaxID=2249466 RepID=A0ABW4I5W0_9SPHN
MQQISVRCVALLVAILGLAQPASAKDSLQQRVEAVLAEAGPGTRFGLVVATADGRELVAVAPDNRFIPASNTKMFPTAATFALVTGLDQPDATGGAAVRLEKAGRGASDVILTGYGDARLSSAADCTTDCLATLADAVAARTRQVLDVVGDDSLFPDQRWSPGMSWNNIPTSSGTAISALTLDDNEIALQVIPGAVGAQPRIDLALAYYTIENRAVTVAAGKTELNVARLPGQRTVRLTGAIARDAKPEDFRLGVDDPAHYAAWRLKALLEARGVKVSGAIQTRHRPFMPSDDPKLRGATPLARPPQPEALARLVPPPLIEDLTHTNKVSQNLHAELFLRRLGLIDGSGSIEDGEAAVKAMLARAGVPRAGFDFSDGSGMSTYNRLAPRAVVTFLRWIAAQPWGAAWRTTLPIGGVDGTLRNRFKGTALEGKLTAKTGTLNASNALSGYFTAKSGQTLTFSAFANDVPSEASATKAMDAALELVASEN